MLCKDFIGIILNVFFILLYFTIDVRRMVFLAMKAFASFQNVLRRTTAMVYTFLQDLIPHIKINYPQVKKIIYFSDGCAGQYKNRYNFINILNHEKDFELQVEWNFFSTSHGKNACDGIGGTLNISGKDKLTTSTRKSNLNSFGFFRLLQQKYETHCNVLYSNKKS